jgi:hypothetical protein
MGNDATPISERTAWYPEGVLRRSHSAGVAGQERHRDFGVNSGLTVWPERMNDQALNSTLQSGMDLWHERRARLDRGISAASMGNWRIDSWSSAPW